MKYKTQRGGGLKLIEEPQGEGEQAIIEEGMSEVSKSAILDRFKPVVRAITDTWEPFPEIDPGLVPPPAPWVLVQKRAPRGKIGSIITADPTREVDGWRERVGKVLAVGAGCYRNVDGTPAFGVIEGWAKAGDLVLIPSSGGTDFVRQAKDGTKVTVTMFHWRDIAGIVTDMTL